MNSTEVITYSRIKDHIYYHIKVNYNGREWLIKKRFSHFISLHNYLQKIGLNPPNTLSSQQNTAKSLISWWFKGNSTPKKNSTSFSDSMNANSLHNLSSLSQASNSSSNKDNQPLKFDESLAKKRLVVLNNYLIDLLKSYNINEHSVLKEFLEVETSWLEYMKKKGEGALNSQQRLEQLPIELEKKLISFTFANNNNSLPSLPPNHSFSQRKRASTITSNSSSNSANISDKSSSFLNRKNSSSLQLNSSKHSNNISNVTIPLNNSTGSGKIFSTPKKSVEYLSSSPVSTSNKERKSSILDLTAPLSFSLSNSVQTSHAKTVYIDAINSLWSYYEEDIHNLCVEEDEEFLNNFYYNEEEDIEEQVSEMNISTEDRQIDSNSESDNDFFVDVEDKTQDEDSHSQQRRKSIKGRKINFDNYENDNNQSSYTFPFIKSLVKKHQNIPTFSSVFKDIETKKNNCSSFLDPFSWNSEPLIFNNFQESEDYFLNKINNTSPSQGPNSSIIKSSKNKLRVINQNEYDD